MIIGLGIDIVEIDRFVHWNKKSNKQLKRIFSPGEIAYCLDNTLKSAERFAARFAAKEAFYKAVFHLIRPKPYFLCICRNVEVTAHNFRLGVSWQSLGFKNGKNITIHLSISHSNNYATAFVILENRT